MTEPRKQLSASKSAHKMVVEYAELHGMKIKAVTDEALLAFFKKSNKRRQSE